MDDLISRQQAIGEAERWLYDGDDKRTIGEMLGDLPSAQPEWKWIPVSKKLPKEDTPVLVTDDAGGMATVGIDSCGRYEDTGERFWYTSQNVTAWMYTVEPYGGEQE